MGNNETRLGATFFIWLALTIIMLAMLGAEQFNFIIGGILAGAAMFATAAVWQKGADGGADKAVKNKRVSRVERFVDNLSDNELDELRARLISSTDGEMVSVDELLNEIDRRAVR
jgi:cell division protein FtsW (lipid II flippase)